MFKKHNLYDFESTASINNGYLECYYPEHPNAMSNGCVYYHRLVMENSLFRYLDNSEYVHHKDENKLNNKSSNLQITDVKEHNTLHRVIPEKECPVCHKMFYRSSRTAIYCCKECFFKSNYFVNVNGDLTRKPKIEWPSKEELEKLVWEKPTTAIAEELGVSDKAVSKRCKKYGIEKPPRGYWAKQDAQEYKIVNSNGTVWPTKEELEKLVWEKPIKIIAKEIGVDYNSISNRCRKFGIETPPNSHWKKTEYRDYVI